MVSQIIRRASIVAATLGVFSAIASAVLLILLPGWLSGSCLAASIVATLLALYAKEGC